MARSTRTPSAAKRSSKDPYRRRVISEVRPAILSLSASDLEAWLAVHSAPAYRRKQIWGWLARGAASVDAMADIPQPVPSELDGAVRISSLPQVAESVRRLSDPELLGISARRIVVSTSGLIPRVTQLGEEKISVTLAISLHAARNELRDVLVPINRKYPVADLVAAAQAYAGKTSRRVSYECVLLAGVNDTERDAKELGRLLRGKLAHVNLIPFNPVEDTPYRAPDRAAVRRFKELVEAQGLTVTVRDTRGRDADAACGQLHERVMRERSAVAAS